MNLMDLSGHIAFILIACSFLVQNILSLRIISIVSSIAAIIYNYYALDEPLWLVINWNIIFLVIHITNIGIYFYKNRKIDFNSEEKEIYEKVFKDLSHTEFMNLVQLGKFYNFKKNTVLMCEGKNCNMITLIINGKVKLISNGNELTQIENGNFIGETDLFNNELKKAFITAKASENTKCLIWRKRDLLKHLKNNKDLQNSFITLINKNINHKLKEIV